MRMNAFLGAGIAAIMSHAMRDLQLNPEPSGESKFSEPEPPYQGSRPFKGRGGKRYAAGRYKGSRWAKKASRLGGNPARF